VCVRESGGCTECECACVCVREYILMQQHLYTQQHLQVNVKRNQIYIASVHAAAPASKCEKKSNIYNAIMETNTGANRRMYI